LLRFGLRARDRLIECSLATFDCLELDVAQVD